MRLDVDLNALRPGSLHLATKLSVPTQLACVAQDDQRLLLAVGRPRLGEDLLSPQALLARYAELGAEMVTDLRGTYGIAIVDADRGELLLFNDRMSVQGWCYAQEDGRIRVSPRADIIADGACIDPQALFCYLFNHIIPAPTTVFSGVLRLPQASMLRARANAVDVRTHWQPAFTETRHQELGALKAEFLSLVRASVAREARQLGSTSIGTFLSGGTDSSTVSGMLQEILGTPIRAYSIGFDADGYDEMSFARIAAKRFGLDHREYYLTPDDVATGMPLVATYYDQPFGNSSAVAGYHCARVAREDGREALLAGDGGDELFGGNARYAKQALLGMYGNIPAPLRTGILQPLLDNRWVAQLPGLAKLSSYVQQARVPMPKRLHMYNLLVRLGLTEVLTPGFLERVRPDEAMQVHERWYEASRGASHVNRMLAYDWKFTLADNDLPKVIGTTALAGVDIGFPLLSDEMIDFSLRLPTSYKLQGQQLRWFFKEALRGFLPDEIITKKKQGFGLPFGTWALRHPQLARLADEALASFGTRGVVNPRFMVKLRTELLPTHPGYYGELVWIIAMLELWLRQHRPDFSLPS